MAFLSFYQMFSVFYEEDEPDMDLWQPLAFGWIFSHLFLVIWVSPALQFVQYEEEANQEFWDLYWEEREAEEALAAE